MEKAILDGIAAAVQIEKARDGGRRHAAKQGVVGHWTSASGPKAGGPEGGNGGSPPKEEKKKDEKVVDAEFEESK